MALLVVGYDGSPPARRALEHVASRVTKDDEVVVISVIPPTVRGRSFSAMMPAGMQLPPEMDATFEQRAKDRLDEIVAQLGQRGVRVRGEVLAGEPATAILARASELQAAGIVIGHKAFEGTHLTLGHNADAILRGAKIPVTVVP